jgi:RNA polymerase primary sigma factor
MLRGPNEARSHDLGTARRGHSAYLMTVHRLSTMTREANNILPRSRELELAESIEIAHHQLAEAIADSSPALRALCVAIKQAKRSPADAAQLFLGLGDDWAEAGRTLDDLLIAVRCLLPKKGSGSQPTDARAARVDALLRARPSHQAIDRLLSELEARLLEQLEGHPSLTRTISTLKSCRATYESAKAALVRANMGLVFTMANNRSHPGLALSDLVQEGTLGLMRAVDRFDHRRGIKFGTYAGWWIRHALNRALSDYARTIRLPVHLLDARYKVRRAAEQFRQQTGSEPTDADLSKQTGLPLKKIGIVTSAPCEPISLDAPMGEDGEGQLGAMIPDTSGGSPIDAIAAKQAEARVRELLKTLTPREEEVIRLRFGIDCPEPLRLEDVGQRFALSRERARQIEAGALRKLHWRAATEQLDSLLAN